MKYVIKRTDDGQYVRPRGSVSSYTKMLQRERVFKSREAAQEACCEANERVMAVEDEMFEED